MLPSASHDDDGIDAASLNDRADSRSARIVDPREFIRFVITGITATAGNMAAVAIALRFASYQLALLVGIAAGASISFPLAKIFAFQSRDWRDTRREMPRFALVYAVGVTIAWLVSMAAGHGILLNILPRVQAELLGALLGASTCTVTNYLGHRFYTYRRRDTAS